jgi:hypothetical protein
VLFRLTRKGMQFFRTGRNLALRRKNRRLQKAGDRCTKALKLFGHNSQMVARNCLN